MTRATSAATVTALAPPSHAFEVACTSDRSHVRHLRQITAGHLGLWNVNGPVAGNIVLAISELASNAVLYGKGDIVRYAAPRGAAL